MVRVTVSENLLLTQLSFFSHAKNIASVCRDYDRPIPGEYLKKIVPLCGRDYDRPIYFQQSGLKYGSRRVRKLAVLCHKYVRLTVVFLGYSGSFHYY